MTTRTTTSTSPRRFALPACLRALARSQGRGASPRALRGVPCQRGQRGVALILVLWTFAAIAVLAAEFARAMHDEAASTRNFKESAQGRMIAIAGLNEALLALRADRHDADVEEFVDEGAEPDPVRALSHADGQWVPASFRGHRYEVRVMDEGGKFSLNTIGPETLLILFENLEIEDEDAKVIADSIVDWRDSDDLHQTNGAESEYYEGLDRPYRCKNAWFDSIEELMLVRGMTRDYFYGHDGLPGLREIFSVFSRNKNLNPNSLTLAVLIAATGMEPQDAFELGSNRHGSGGQGTIDDLRARLGALGIGTKPNDKPSLMTVEARVHDASGRIVLAHLGAVVDIGRGGDGLRLHRWYDSIFEDSDSTGASAPDETS